jgi:hypothetical protein
MLCDGYSCWTHGDVTIVELVHVRMDEVYKGVVLKFTNESPQLSTDYNCDAVFSYFSRVTSAMHMRINMQLCGR